MGRIIAVDFGLSRIGLAHSNHDKKFAFPIKNVSNDNFLDELRKILDSDEYDAVLFGIPFRKNGTEGDLAVEIREIALKVEKRFNISVVFTDETLSSKAAAGIIVEQGLSYKKRKKKRKEKLDALAAAHFLQNYLDKGQYDKS
ncbi:MAG: Holliday junction resolvase RuvX [Planctomycetes bacterium]|nr:Holliday junction resolvase RuvX [Planctomycetota bacterium]